MSVLATLSGNIYEAGRWGMKKLIDFAYGFLEFHVLVSENSDGTRPETFSVHSRLKLPQFVGGFETRWRYMLSLHFDGRLVFNENIEMIAAALLREDDAQSADAIGVCVCVCVCACVCVRVCVCSAPRKCPKFLIVIGLPMCALPVSICVSASLCLCNSLSLRLSVSACVSLPVSVSMCRCVDAWPCPITCNTASQPPSA